MDQTKGPEYRFEKPKAKPGTIFLVCGALALGAVATLGVVLFRPKPNRLPTNPTPRLAMLRQSLAHIECAKVRVYAVNRSRRTLVEEQFFDHGYWRIERPGLSDPDHSRRTA